MVWVEVVVVLHLTLRKLEQALRVVLLYLVEVEVLEEVLRWVAEY